MRRLSWVVAALLIFHLPPAGAAANEPASASAAKIPRHFVYGGDYDYPPFEWLDKNGRPQGFNVDLVRAIGDVMGCDVEVRLGPWPRIRQALEHNGAVDVSDMFFSKEQARMAAFSAPFWEVHDEIFARRSARTINTLKELAGREVLCQQDSTAVELLRQAVPTAKLILVTSEPEAVRRLALGQHDYAIITSIAGRYAIRQNDLRNLITTGPPLWPRDYCLVTAKNRPQLLADLNQGLAILKKTGRFNEIYDKWFEDVQPRNPRLNKFLAFLPWIAIGLAALAVAVAAWIGILRHTVRQRTRELRKSEQQFRLIMENLDDLVAVLDLNGCRLYNSPSYQKILGDPDKLRGTSSFDQVHPEDRMRVQKVFQETVRTGAGQRLEYRMMGRDGQARHIESQGSVIRDDQGRVSQVVVVSRDVTSRIRAEDLLRRLNRVFATLSNVNQIIVREKDPQAMLEAVCRIAVDTGKFRMAWVGLLNPETQELKPAASQGVVEGYTDLVEINLRDKTRATGPAARCLLSGEHAICNDIASDPLYLPWQDEALRRGYQSSGAFPLKVEGRVAGVFSLYAETPGFFDEEEMRLLDELASDVSFALEINQREKERQQAENELRWRTAFFEAQVDSALDGILVVDSQGKKILQNQRMIDLWKIPPHINRNKDDATQVEFVASQTKHPKQFVEKVLCLNSHPDEVSRDEVELVNGTVLDRYSSPVRDKAGNYYGRIWTFRDITERKRAGESFARLATAVEQSAETIIITDTRGTILYTNPAFEKTSGYTCAEALGQNPRFLKSGRHDAEFYRQMWETLRRGEIWSGHFVNRRKDGAFFEEDATISPVRDAAGKVVNYVAVKRDVTREAQLEAQFLQSQKMEAIGHLAGGVAHDFNNMLAAIIMQTEVTETIEHLPEAALEGLREIRVTAEHAADLTSQLLAFSRRQVMQTRMVNLNEIVTSLAKMLQRILGEDVRLQLNLHPSALPIRADPRMLDQVLLNLAVNARDAMPDGGHLTIETGEKMFTEEEARAIPDIAPGRHVCLRVTDTGSGIAPENLSRIFEPFFTTKGPGKGTGLGLATVFGIVKQHCGSIAVESEVGRGAAFQICLPATEDVMELPEEIAAKPKPRGGTETVLLADDDPSVRMLMRIVLERNGYRVLEAADGVEALRIWEQHAGPIHLLLTDIVMPEGISGRELAAQLLQRNPKLRVIFTSGYSADIAGRELVLEEGQNFLQKPCPSDHILETVRKSLDG